MYGVEIGTLDNPGWTVKVDLTDTPLTGLPFDRLEAHYTDDDWVVCWVDKDSFHVACGPLNLEEALVVFLDWAGIEPTGSATLSRVLATAQQIVRVEIPPYEGAAYIWRLIDGDIRDAARALLARSRGGTD